VKGHSFTSDARTYGLVLLTLLVLTAITVAAAGVRFGSPAVNVVVALTIATMKAALIAFYFMHLRHDNPMNALIFVTGLVVLGALLMLTLVDVETRLPVQPSGAVAPIVRNPA
jgi:cytochrome c oxidase subunit 4